MKKTSLPQLCTASLERIYSFKTSHSWSVRNPERFQQLMEEAASLVEPGVFLGDNLFTWGRNNSALDDAPFMQAWQSNILSDPFPAR